MNLRLEIPETPTEALICVVYLGAEGFDNTGRGSLIPAHGQ